ncbi:MAG: hypothetical protein QXT43_00590 [Candidatus Micrarchaeaceae archaeon]
MADQNQAGQPVTTSIDDLVKYLGEHGETDSIKLSRDLNVTEPIIETWANVLEKSNIVHISYKVGRMYVSKAAATPEEETAIKNRVAQKQGILEDELAVQARLISDITEQIDQFKKYMGEVDRVYRERAGEIKKVMDTINAYNDELNKLQGNIGAGVEYISKLRSELDSGLSQLGEKSAALDSIAKGSGAAEAQRLVDDMNAKMSLARQELSDMRGMLEKQLDSQRKRFLELEEEIRRESRALESLIGQMKKEILDYNASLSNYSKEAESIRSKVNSGSKRLVDEAAKTEQQAMSIYGAAQKQANALASLLLDIKNKFPEVSKLSDTLSDINKSIASAEAEKNQLASEIQQLSLQLKSLSASKTESLASKDSKLGDIEPKVKEIANRSNKLKKESDKIRDKAKRLGGK